ncbi:MAG: AAA family ATPase, partial [Bacteroidaceae bacterium]|nr:AAA family ATPase [Bacteroidaceae bacterium]
TIIIMTSNLGSGYIQEQFEKINNGNREAIIEETKEQLMEMLKKSIRPEFLNRIDETIMFTPLDRNEIEQIVRLQVSDITDRLAENGVTLHVTAAAISTLANEGFDPQFGARPIKRAIQRYMLNELSKQLIAGTINREHPVTVDSENDMLTFKN